MLANTRSARAALLLRSPRALAVVGRTTGIYHLDDLVRAAESPGQRPVPSDAIGLADDTQEFARFAVGAVSGWAWQPAAAGVRELLRSTKTNRRFGDAAGFVAGAAATQWWWDPVDPDRQVLLGSPTEAPDITRMLEADASRVGEYTSELPLSGVVTSTRLGPAVPAVSLCSVTVTGRLPEPIGCWQLTPRRDVRVLELARPSDWLALCERYPIEVRAPDQWRHWGVPDGRGLIPDWAAVAEDWDGVHLSMSGLLTIAGAVLSCGPAVTILEGEVDTEATVWFRNPFAPPELIAVWTEDGSSSPTATTSS